MSGGQEQQLLEQGLDRVRQILGPDWKITEYNVGMPQPSNLPRSVAPDAVLNHVVTVESHGARMTCPVLVEVTTDPTPAAISRSLAPRLDLMLRLTGDAAVLVIAPWLSPRARKVLEDLGYGYLDLTGNTWLRLPRLGVHVQTVGEQRDPKPSKGTWRQQLRGDKAGRLVRVLADVRPPYRGTDLGKASGLSLGYISRLLDALEDQRLIRRDNRAVVWVDWAGLLRERAGSYGLLKGHPPVPMVAQRGVDHVLAQLHMDRWDEEDHGRVAVTGSAAAAKVAPLAVGGQLMVHLEEVTDDALEALRRPLGLLPAESGADVLLLRSTGSEALLGRRLVDGVPHVAYSQLVLDCLGGPGRLPAEAEAVLKHLQSMDETWRLTSLGEWADDRR
jgi:hypothetical protein